MCVQNMITFLWSMMTDVEAVPIEIYISGYTTEDSCCSWLISPHLFMQHMPRRLLWINDISLHNNNISKGFQITKLSGWINCLIHVYITSELYIQVNRLSQHPDSLLSLCAEQLFDSYFLVFLKANQISKKKKKSLAIMMLIFWHITFNYLFRIQ